MPNESPYIDGEESVEVQRPLPGFVNHQLLHLRQVTLQHISWVDPVTLCKDENIMLSVKWGEGQGNHDQ